ncbi:MAG: hypothetical protein ACRYF3_01330 [Janthinobacterium lividum]
MTVSKTVWFSWAGASLATFAVLEVMAVQDGVAGDSLSANWWELRTHLPARLLVFPPLAWVGYHLFIPWDRKTGGWDDTAVVVGGVGIALLARYRPRSGA